MGVLDASSAVTVERLRAEGFTRTSNAAVATEPGQDDPRVAGHGVRRDRLRRRDQRGLLEDVWIEGREALGSGTGRRCRESEDGAGRVQDEAREGESHG